LKNYCSAEVFVFLWINDSGIPENLLPQERNKAIVGVWLKRMIDNCETWIAYESSVKKDVEVREEQERSFEHDADGRVIRHIAVFNHAASRDAFNPR